MLTNKVETIPTCCVLRRCSCFSFSLDQAYFRLTYVTGSMATPQSDVGCQITHPHLLLEMFNGLRNFDKMDQLF